MANDKDEIKSNRLILPSKEVVDFTELARKTGPSPGVRKLTPAPGRTPRGSSVPKDEILPRKDK